MHLLQQHCTHDHTEAANEPEVEATPAAQLAPAVPATPATPSAPTQSSAMDTTPDAPTTAAPTEVCSRSGGGN